MSVKHNIIIGIFLLFIVLSNAERARFDNYRVYKLIASSAAELSVLRNIDGECDSLIFLDGIHKAGQDVHVVVAPHKLPDFLEILGTNGLNYELVEQNFQNVLESDEIEIAPRGTSEYNWRTFYELDDTYRWLESLAEKYPSVVTLIEGGMSYEGRAILGVKISYNNSQSEKPGIFMEGGMNAREWISSATATYLINDLLTSDTAAVMDIAQNYDWYIFPHTNPDGYVYTHTTNRMWRKTRTPYGTCFGADANLNWNFHWSEVGANNHSCSDMYAGPHAFSEIETRTLSNYMNSLKGKLQVFVSFHAYSEQIFYPYGHTAELPENNNDLRKVLTAMQSAIFRRYGSRYGGGIAHDFDHPTSGTCMDWAYSTIGTKMAFTFNLPPMIGQFLSGYKISANRIIPIGQEIMDALVAMVGEVKNLGYFD